MTSDCALCKIRFSSVSAFDKHLRWKDGLSVHVDPAEIKELCQRDDGVWTGLPMKERTWRDVGFSDAL